jgi:hypothetical protein
MKLATAPLSDVIVERVKAAARAKFEGKRIALYGLVENDRHKLVFSEYPHKVQVTIFAADSARQLEAMSGQVREEYRRQFWMLKNPPTDAQLAAIAGLQRKGSEPQVFVNAYGALFVQAGNQTWAVLADGKSAMRSPTALRQAVRCEEWERQAREMKA